MKKEDWIWTCINDLKDIGFKQQKLKENSFKHLMKKQRNKGKEITYKEFQIAEYLMPNETMKNVEDQRYLFAIRNKMINIPANIGKQEKCICGDIEKMSHIYYCYGKEEKLPYENVYNGKLKDQEKIMNIFRNNMKIRETIIHEIAGRSTNFCPDISNGINR